MSGDWVCFLLLPTDYTDIQIHETENNQISKYI